MIPVVNSSTHDHSSLKHFIRKQHYQFDTIKIWFDQNATAVKIFANYLQNIFGFVFRVNVNNCLEQRNDLKNAEHLRGANAEQEDFHVLCIVSGALFQCVFA